MMLIPITQMLAWIHLSESTALKAGFTAASSLVLILSYYQRIVNTDDVFYAWLPIGLWAVFGVVWYQHRRAASPGRQSPASS